MENERENGLEFQPKFDANGLVTAVITDNSDGIVLMVGHMNADAIRKTLETGTVYFFSRSRQALWQKGETSGNTLRLVDAFVDCDQDAIWIKAEPDGPTCHTGRRSCFYRRLTADGLKNV
jgi:phosphoribosyl-AMP cyclohydrolase